MAEQYCIMAAALWIGLMKQDTDYEGKKNYSPAAPRFLLMYLSFSSNPSGCR